MDDSDAPAERVAPFASPPPASVTAPPPLTGSRFDPDLVASDFEGVEVALERLDAGTYWSCEVTGEELPDELLAANPVVRRLPPAEPTSRVLAADRPAFPPPAPRDTPGS